MKVLSNPSPELFFEKYFKNLPLGHEVLVLRYAILFATQFLSAIGLPTPYFLVIDNCLIQDLLQAEKKEERKIRATALLLFTHYLKEKFAVPIYIAFTPITLYEFVGKRLLKDEIDFEENVSSLKILLKDTNLSILPFKIGSFEEANENLKRIIWDAEEVTQKIRLIRQQQWNIRIKNEIELFHCFQIAQEQVPEPIVLRYLNENFARYILASLIEMLIWESPVQSKHLRKKFLEISQGSAAKILKIKGRDLKGLGDVQILSFCSIQSQFMAEQHFSFVALTADDILHSILIDSARRTRSVSNMDENGNKISEREISRFSQETVLDIKNMNLTNKIYFEFKQFLAEILDTVLKKENSTIESVLQEN